MFRLFRFLFQGSENPKKPYPVVGITGNGKDKLSFFIKETSDTIKDCVTFVGREQRFQILSQPSDHGSFHLAGYYKGQLIAMQDETRVPHYHFYDPEKGFPPHNVALILERIKKCFAEHGQPFLSDKAIKHFLDDYDHYVDHGEPFITKSDYEGYNNGSVTMPSVAGHAYCVNQGKLGCEPYRMPSLPIIPLLVGIIAIVGLFRCCRNKKKPKTDPAVEVIENKITPAQKKSS